MAPIIVKRTVPLPPVSGRSVPALLTTVRLEPLTTTSLPSPFSEVAVIVTLIVSFNLLYPFGAFTSSNVYVP